MEFIIFFLILVLGAALIAWIIQGCPAPRRVDHYHYHRYKRSTDYGHLWDLIVNQGLNVVVDTGGEDDCMRYDNGHRYGNRIYGVNGHYDIEDGKEGFCHYCAWQKLSFFDLADEVKD